MTRGVPSPFRDDLDFGKKRCGRTNLNTARIVGYPSLTTDRLGAGFDPDAIINGGTNPLLAA